MPQHTVIVGASHAGAQLAISLRQEGWSGHITLIGDEGDLPYQHPPLSKDYLSGHKNVDDLLLRPKALYEKEHINLRLAARVSHIDRDQQRITLEYAGQREQLHYDKLALCTGARVRSLSLPGSDLGGVHYLRTVADVEAT